MVSSHPVPLNAILQFRKYTIDKIRRIALTELGEALHNFRHFINRFARII
jgi:hypothetical protein